jgi:hypothetical protein
VDWIKENNRWGVDAPIVKDMTGQIDSAITAHENFCMTLGEHLLSAGSPVYVTSWDGEFMIIPLTAEQARAMEVGESSASFATHKWTAVRDASPVLSVQSVTFENADNVDGSKSVSGELTCQITGDLPEGPAIRISYGKNNSTVASYSYPKDLKGSGQVTVKFSMSAVNSKDDEKKYHGPLPVFVDVCTINQQSGDTRIISNTVARLITVSPEP